MSTNPTPPPSLAEAALRPLDRRLVAMGRVTRWISALVLGGITLVPLASYLAVARPAAPRLWLAIGAWALFVALLVVRAHFWPELAWRYAGYRIGSDGIEIRRGVLWRSVRVVPLSRVQHTDVGQGPIERSFGLATLTIFTAGTAHAAVPLEGLSHADALSIRDLLVAVGRDDGV